MHTCIKLIGFIFVWLLTNKYQRKPPISPLLSSPLYSFAIQCVSCLSDHLFIVSFCLVLLISLLVRLGCCFVEIKRNAIQASAKGKNVQSFAASIIKGDYYQISGFYTFENRYTNSVVAHEVIIDLKFDTKVTRLNPLTPLVPRHHFNFIDFAHMLTTGKRSGVLTDVLGRLKAIQPLEQIMVRSQDMTDKREFILENLRGDELRVTLGVMLQKALMILI
uniref:DUF223 domain-containing protein n=1 Tax=Salix viminalis TaxID=40686 RepID=A0A6N2K7H5_SALVM